MSLFSISTELGHQLVVDVEAAGGVEDHRTLQPWRWAFGEGVLTQTWTGFDFPGSSA